MARLNIILLLGMIMTLFATQASAKTEAQWATYRSKCLRKDSRIVAAIDRFCTRDIHVPSTFPGIKFDDNNRVMVKPNQGCMNDGRLKWSNPVWIPQYWCTRQFWKVCAQGNAKGRGYQYFGARKCQQFVITDR